MRLKTVLHGQDPDRLFSGLKDFDATKFDEGGRKSVKTMLTLRLDSAVVEHFRSQGPGWQTRVNAVLRHVMEAAQAPLAEDPCAEG